MYEDDSGILNFVIKCLDITNTSMQNSLFEFLLSKLYRSRLRKLKAFVNKFTIYMYHLY